MQFKVNRDITRKECDWLDEDVKKGTIVFECVKHTYGCIGPSGIAVTMDSNGDYPFFELPYEALTEI